MATAETIGIIEGTPRPDASRGKNEARRLRRGGRVPGVLYGARKGTLAISLDPKQLARVLHSAAGHNTIFDLQVGSEKTKAMIVDWQYEPVKGAILHVDLKRIAMDERMKVRVPIHLIGVPEGVKTQGGVLEQIYREVELECLPADIPTSIDVNVEHLVFGTVLRINDLPHGEGRLKWLTDGNQPVAHIIAVKEEVAPTPAEGVVEAAPAEPEVIKKGKQEVEEGAEPAPAEKAEKAEKPEKAERGEKKEKK